MALAAIAGALGLVFTACTVEESRPPVASAESAGTVGPDGRDTGSTVDVEEDLAEVLSGYVRDAHELAECYRENGFPDLEDPDEYGYFDIDTRGVSDPYRTLLRARKQCSPLEPDLPPALREFFEQQAADAMPEEEKAFHRDFAKCMQENGAPDFPDPKPNGLPDNDMWFAENPTHPVDEHCREQFGLPPVFGELGLEGGVG
jgi:hypothetical protein